MKIPKDKRNKLWPVLEAEIAKYAKKKDKKFRLLGKWKKLYKKEGALRIYKVDGDWVRTNLSIIFGHGGHGYVHEFIPEGEIWINTHHPKACGCKKVRKDRKMSPAYTQSTILHEATEYREMKKGKTFWHAHNLALQAERKAAYLPDPYAESYTK